VGGLVLLLLCVSVTTTAAGRLYVEQAMVLGAKESVCVAFQAKPGFC
jgi:hypothetical protein